MSDEEIVRVPRNVFDDIVTELENAIDSIDNIRHLQAALVRAKRMMRECDPELTPIEHFKNATAELKKGST